MVNSLVRFYIFYLSWGCVEFSFILSFHNKTLQNSNPNLFLKQMMEWRISSTSFQYYGPCLENFNFEIEYIQKIWSGIENVLLFRIYFLNGVFHNFINIIDIMGMGKHIKKMCLVVLYLIDHECCSPEWCGTRQGRVSPHTPAGNLSSRRISTHISDVTICSSKYIKV